MRLAEHSKASFDPKAFNRRLSHRHKLIWHVMPAFAPFIENVWVHRVLAEETRVMVALEAYAAAHGRYPESLGQLVADILPELPSDPLHGGPFGYRVLSEETHGRPYLLYSTGVEQTDDVEQMLETLSALNFIGPKVLFEEGFQGVDFVINQPRPEE